VQVPSAHSPVVICVTTQPLASRLASVGRQRPSVQGSAEGQRPCFGVPMHWPCPSQASLTVQSMPSLQVAPFALLRATQRLVDKSQVACLHWIAGCLQVGKTFEQLHLPLLRHVPVLH